MKNFASMKDLPEVAVAISIAFGLYSIGLFLVLNRGGGLI